MANRRCTSVQVHTQHSRKRSPRMVVMYRLLPNSPISAEDIAAIEAMRAKRSASQKRPH